MSNRDMLLEAYLSLAVPSWAAWLRRFQFVAVCLAGEEHYGWLLKSDDIDIFNVEHTPYMESLALALACRSFLGGGVQFGRLHFDYEHPENPK